MWRNSSSACRGLPGEGAVHGRAGDGEQLCQIADGVLAGAVHPTQLSLLFVGELWWLPPQFALGASDGHAFARADTD